jgi:hypothetical protein
MHRDGKPLAGALFFGTFAIVFLGIAYAMWPADFFSTPFPEMTAGMLLRAVATLGLAALGIQFLCSLVIVTQSDR